MLSSRKDHRNALANTLAKCLQGEEISSRGVLVIGIATSQCKETQSTHVASFWTFHGWHICKCLTLCDIRRNKRGSQKEIFPSATSLRLKHYRIFTLDECTSIFQRHLGASRCASGRAWAEFIKVPSLHAQRVLHTKQIRRCSVYCGKHTRSRYDIRLFQAHWKLQKLQGFNNLASACMQSLCFLCKVFKIFKDL